MFAALLSASLLAPAAPVPKDFAPTGQAPYPVSVTISPTDGVRVLAWQAGVQAVDERAGARLIVGFISSDRPPGGGRRVPLDDLDDLRITTADGKAVTVRDAAKQLAGGTPAVASADGKPVGAAHRRALKPGTLVLVSPDLVKGAKPDVPRVVWDR